jgi:hypothetical protein
MFEAYSIAVKVSLINGVAGGLLNMSKQFATAEMGAASLQRRMTSIGKQLLVGGVLVGAGVGILSLFKGPLEEAKRLQTEVAKFSLYGLGGAANAEALNFAKNVNVAGSTYVDNMRLMTEAQGIFRESGKLTTREQLEGAKIATPILAKLAFIQSSMDPEKRQNAHTQDLAMLRFIEARGGANDPKTFASIADWGYKLQQSSGGVVDWSQLQQFMATAGIAGRITQNGLSALEPVVADLKGGRAGSGLRVADQRLLGTQRGLPKQAVAEYLKLGLWDKSKVELTPQGSISRFLGTPGSVLKDAEKQLQNPFAYFTENFLPAIAKKYGNWILGSDIKAVTARAVEESLVFGPGNASALYQQMDKLAPAIQRSLAAQSKQSGIDSAVAVGADTLEGKQLALHAKFHNLMEQTGETVLPMVVKGLDTLIPMLQGVSNWAKANPNMFAGVIKGLVALGVASTAAGAILIGGATVRALKLLFDVLGGAGSAVGAIGRVVKWLPLIPSLIGGVVGALDTLGIILAATVSVIGWPVIAVGAAIAGIGVIIWQFAKHWDSTKSVWSNIQHIVGGFFDWIVTKAKEIAGFLGKLIGLDSGKVDGTKGTGGPSNAGGDHKVAGIGSYNDQKSALAAARHPPHKLYDLKDQKYLDVNELNSGMRAWRADNPKLQGVIPNMATAAGPKSLVPNHAPTVGGAIPKMATAAGPKSLVPNHAPTIGGAIPKMATAAGPKSLVPNHAPTIGGANPARPANGNSPYVPQKQAMSFTIHNTMKVGERTVATAVNRINARDMNTAATGGSTYDPRASLPMAAGYAA